MFHFFFPFVLREVDREGHAHFSGGGGGEGPGPQHLNVFFFHMQQHFISYLHTKEKLQNL